MALEAGAVFVSVLPEGQGFFSSLFKQVTPAAARVGKAGGKEMTRAIVVEGDKAGKGFASAFGKSSKAGLKAAAVGIAAIGVGAAVAGKKAFTAFADFDKTMRQVGVQTNTTGREFKALNDLALKLGKDTSFSAKQAADAMLELAKGGITKAQIEAGVLAETLTLAAAGGLELGDAASYMVQAMNTFGLAAKDSGQIAAALAGGANASTASVQDLGYALSQVGPGARNTGQSLQETVGTLAAFANAGISGSDAGTSLKTMLDRLTPSTKKAQNTMKDLGINFINADGSFKSLADVAQILQDKLKGLTPAQRSVAIETMFGSDAQRAATVLMNEGAAGIDKYVKATNNQAAAQALAKTNTEGAAGALEQFKGSIDTLLIKTGSVVAPFIESGLKAGTGFVNGLTDSLDGIAAAISSKAGDAKKAFDAFMTGFSGGSVSGSGIFADIGNLGEDARVAFQTAKGHLQDFADAVLPTLTAAGTDLMNAVKEWGSTAFNGIVSAFETGDTGKIGRAIGDAILSGLTMLAESAGTILKALEKLFKEVDWVGLGITIGRQMIPFLIGLAAGILDLDWGTLWEGIVKHWPTILMGVLAIVFAPSKLLKPILNIVRKIPFVGPLIATFIEGIQKWGRVALKYIGKALGFIGKNVFKGIGKALGLEGKGGSFWRVIQAIPTAFGVMLINIGELILKGFGRLGGLFVRGVAFLAEGLGRVIGTLLRPFFNLFKLIGQTVRSGWTFIWDKILKPGLALLGRVWNGTLDMIARVLKGAFDLILKVVRGVWNQVWTNTLKPGLAALRTTWNVAWAYIRDVAGKAFKAFGTGIQWVKSHIIDPVFNGIKTGIGLVVKGFENAQKGIATAWDKVANTVKKPIAWVLENVYGNDKKGIKSVFDKIASTVGLDIRLPAAPKISTYKDGGLARGKGTGRSDSMLARISNGEYIMPRDSVRKYGTKFLDRLRARDYPAYKNGGVVAPVPGRHSGFPGYRGHTGVDYPVGMGTTVRAAMGGIVKLVQHLRTSYGNNVRVSHGGGLETIYAHLSRTLVNIGDKVNAGSVIGKSGSTGNSTGPHLHFETRRNGKFFNPDSFLSGAESQGGVFDAIGGFLENAWKKAKNVGDWVADKAQAAYDFVSHPGDVLKKFLGQAVSGLAGKIPGGGDLLKVAKAMPDHMVDTIAGAGTKLASKIKNVFTAGDSAPKGDLQRIAAQMASKYGWGADQFAALKDLWHKESGWRVNATNPSSGAYGIPQAWPASKMASAGKDWRTNGVTQIRWGLKYIDDAYGSPMNALSKWKARSPHWYGTGTRHAKAGWAVVGDRGPEMLKLRGGEQIKNDKATSKSLAGDSGNTYIYQMPNYMSPDKLMKEAERRRAFREKVGG